jgi:hypothetical protein
MEFIRDLSDEISRRAVAVFRNDSDVQEQAALVDKANRAADIAKDEEYDSLQAVADVTHGRFREMITTKLLNNEGFWLNIIQAIQETQIAEDCIADDIINECRKAVKK